MKIGFIGCGNMGSAMIKGIKSTYKDNVDIYVSDLDKVKLNKIKEKYNVIIANNQEVVKNAEIFFLAVKPNVYDEVLNEIKELVSADKIVITIAAGKKISDVQNKLGAKKIVRIMPNTPAMVGEAMTAIVFNELISEEEKNQISDIIKSFGKLQLVDEKYMSAMTALAGSSPAYIYMVIEAMADAGVLLGLKREDSYKIVAQSVLGSAKMVLESGEIPAKLKDDVCSPAGTTIEAVRVLEQKGIRSAFIEAIKSCHEKSESMSK